MNIDKFASLLFESDEETIEKYIKSDEVQSQLLINSGLAAIVHILVIKGLVTEKVFEKIRNNYKEYYQENAKKTLFEQLNKYKEEE